MLEHFQNQIDAANEKGHTDYKLVYRIRENAAGGRMIRDKTIHNVEAALEGYQFVELNRDVPTFEKIPE